MPNLPKKSTVLLIEDHLDLREPMTELLEEQNYQVSAIESVEAVFEMPNLCWDLVIIDDQVLGEDGLSLMTRLMRVQPNAFIIMLTAANDIDFKVSAFNAGVDMLIAKPVNPIELMAVVYATLRRKHRIDVKTASVQLDPYAKLLTFRSRMMRVSANETLVLQTMALAETNITEFYQLKIVLGFIDQEGKNRLEVLISRLRKKIADQLDLHELIVAERGVGYKLTHPLVIV